MQLTVAALNDGRIAVLIDGRILEGDGMVPVGAIVADGNRTWCANTLRSKWQCLEVVIDKCVTPVFQRNSISTTLVVLDVEQGDWCPGIAIVA